MRVTRYGIGLTVFVAVIVAACGGGDSASDVPDLDFSETLDSEIVVGRVVEARVPDDGSWVPVGRDQATVQSDGTATVAAAPGRTVFARFRLTIRVIGLEIATYDVLVSGDCYDVVTTGTPWPSAESVCQ